MASIHQTLREVRGLYQDVLKLHQEVLACHGKAQEFIQRIKKTEERSQRAYDELSRLHRLWQKRLNHTAWIVMVELFMVALTGGMAGEFLALVMFRLTAGAN